MGAGIGGGGGPLPLPGLFAVTSVYNKGDESLTLEDKLESFLSRKGEYRNTHESCYKFCYRYDYSSLFETATPLMKL